MHCPKNSSLRVRHPCVFFGTSEQFHPSTLHWVSSLWFWNTSPALRNLLAPTDTISLGGRDPSPALPLLSPPYPAEPPKPCQSPPDRPRGETSRRAAERGPPPSQQLHPRGAHTCHAWNASNGPRASNGLWQNRCPISKSKAHISLQKLRS